MDKKRLVEFLATGFYTGYARRAPGTCGTVAAALCCWVVSLVNPELFEGVTSWVFAAAFTLLAIFLSEWSLRWELFGAGIKDPQRITVDEFAGYFFALAGNGGSWGAIVAAFVFFRVFDITKFFPGRLVEGLPGGYGIVLDDIVAGLYANVVVFLLFRLI